MLPSPIPSDANEPTPAAVVGGGATLEIDLGAVADNWRALDRLTPPACETAAAVKADGYGLGAGPAARALHAAGCRTFFVATLGEAITLDAALGLGRAAALYVLNGFAPADRPAGLPPERLRPVVSTLEDAAIWAEAAPGAPSALQLETGMNRLGVADTPEADAALAALAPRLAPALVMSHLACADAPDAPANAAQKARFDVRLARLRPAFPAARASLAATGGVLLGAAYAYDLVRPGVGLYGAAPFAEARACVRLSAPLLRVWDVAAGAASGYGWTWTAARPSRLATIPLGYADGLPRALSNRGVARIGARIVPIAGRVSMDLTVLDVTDAGPLEPGARAVLLDAALTVDRMAAAADTIGYEILTKLGYRARRIYTSEA